MFICMILPVWLSGSFSWISLDNNLQKLSDGATRTQDSKSRDRERGGSSISL